jgi:predicted MFS family arabinose efflux permease
MNELMMKAGNALNAWLGSVGADNQTAAALTAIVMILMVVAASLALAVILAGWWEGRCDTRRQTRRWGAK